MDKNVFTTKKNIQLEEGLLDIKMSQFSAIGFIVNKIL